MNLYRCRVIVMNTYELEVEAEDEEEAQDNAMIDYTNERGRTGTWVDERVDGVEVEFIETVGEVEGG